MSSDGKKSQSGYIPKYTYDMDKINKLQEKVNLRKKKADFRNKVFKYANRVFWTSSILFVLWVSTGFYDLFPRMKLDEKIEEYRAQRNIRYAADSKSKDKDKQTDKQKGDN